MLDSSPKIVLPVVLLRGTPREMGRQYAAIDPTRILEIYDSRMAGLIAYAAEDGVTATEEQALALVRKCLPIVEGYAPDGIAELQGISDVTGLPLEKVWFISAYTDVRDYLRFVSTRLEGCTMFFAGADTTVARKTMIGQTWDLGTEDMRHVVAQHRKPDNAPECWTITVSGALPMIGMNEHGVACCTNDLNSGDGKPGVCYLDILSSVLRTDNLSDAVDAVINAPRLGGHNYMLADGIGLATEIETTAEKYAAFPLTRGVFVHTNHYVDPSLAPLEKFRPPSSQARRYQMHTLLQNGIGKIDADYVRSVFSDRGGEHPINRYDDDNMSTNACLIMSPVERKMWMCRAQADRGEWIEAEFDWEEEPS